MSQLLDQLEPESLQLAAPLPLALHPAAVYLNGLAGGSRRTMRQSLDAYRQVGVAIAALLTAGQCDADTLDWAKLRDRHTAAVRAALLESREPATVKKMLSALRRVLLEARKLKLMAAQEYEEAIALAPIRERVRQALPANCDHINDTQCLFQHLCGSNTASTPTTP